MGYGLYMKTPLAPMQQLHITEIAYHIAVVLKSQLRIQLGQACSVYEKTMETG